MRGLIYIPGQSCLGVYWGWGRVWGFRNDSIVAFGFLSQECWRLSPPSSFPRAFPWPLSFSLVTRALLLPLYHVFSAHFFYGSLLLPLNKPSGCWIEIQSWVTIWCLSLPTEPRTFYLLVVFPTWKSWNSLRKIATGTQEYICVCIYRKQMKDFSVFKTFILLES